MHVYMYVKILIKPNIYRVSNGFALHIVQKKIYHESPEHARTKLMCSYSGWMGERSTGFLKIQANK